jgi:thioredoxin reductase (NADPH)
MSRQGPLPTLFVVVCDRGAVDVLVGDLDVRFGHDFEVHGEVAPDAALAELERMAAAHEQLALLLVDAGAYGVLPHAHELFPRAKRVLLVDRDYRATSPAVQALMLGQADYHLVRPWSNNESMYRAMTEFLASWTREHEPRYELFRIVASESDSRLPHLRETLRRFSMPFVFSPLEGEEGRHLLEEAGLDESSTPALIWHDGHVIVDPSLQDLARAIGASIENTTLTCDVAIVGAGPAGLTTAVYAASEGLETLLLEQTVSGGQAGSSPLIRNYPGFPHGVDGGLLMERTCEQAWLMGAHIVFTQQVMALEAEGDDRVLTLQDGSALRARAVVIATGIDWRRLGVPSVEALVGSGVYYGAAVSESRAMLGQDVFIVGAGNSAGQAALHLAKHARTVTVLVRGESFSRSMSAYLVRAIESTPNVIVRQGTQVVDAAGDGVLRRLTITDRRNGTTEEVPAAGLFIMIGGSPRTEWLPEQIVRDDQGYVITGRDLADEAVLGAPGYEPQMLETSIPGVFAAGDVRHGAIRRVASAVGEGATVVRMVHEHLRDLESRSAPGYAVEA